MREKLTNEERHERFWCARTHPRVAWFIVGFCALETCLTGQSLHKPFLRTSAFYVAFYILLLTLYIPVYLRVFRCFRERFVVAVGAIVFGRATIYWFWPALFDPYTFDIRRLSLALWIVALLLSITMLVESLREPYAAPPDAVGTLGTRGVMVVTGIVAAALVIGALLYLLPGR